jgi:predicted amidohydrolase YtcJ
MRLATARDGYGRFFMASTQLAPKHHMYAEQNGLSADLALINTNIKTMNPKQPTAQAVAITKNRITKVGTNQQIRKLIGENTRVLDLKGKTVLPGLIDTHIHVTDYGRCLMWLDLTLAKSLSEIKNVVKEKAKSLPKGKWIIGQGWNESRFKELRMPTITDLDEAAPDNPVILYREASMICAVNSMALKLSGVNEQTVIPEGGAVDKDPDTGKVTGIFRDTATSLVWQAVPEPTEGELLTATVFACQKIFQSGITSIHWLVISESELSIIQKLHAMGQLMFRVNVVIPEALLEKTAAIQSGNSDVLRVGGVFIVVDGYLDSKEAALQEPYSDDPSNYGRMLLTEEALAASVQRALRFGVQPVIHAMGDKAIDATLTIVEQTQKPNVRFRIEQAAVLNEALIQRLKKQDVVITIQPKVISTEFTVWSANQRLGGRAKWLHPLKTLLSQGIALAAGSDCPMEPLSALLGIQELVTRPSCPEQRLSVDEAIRLYTLNAAYCSGEEQIKGSIEEAKLADLIVLAEDPESVELNKIKDIPVDFVILNGKVLVVTS